MKIQRLDIRSREIRTAMESAGLFAAEIGCATRWGFVPMEA